MLQRKERTKLVKLEKIAYPKTSSTGLVPRRENKLYAQMPGNLMQTPAGVIQTWHFKKYEIGLIRKFFGEWREA
ncbi:hypothetical protein Y1Q_0016747 [Alligator mississippiensis]|uniref:Uncharacterized protein n=1 Tax=Alligator mississippiensis TaxID=8496 RepID=A0A151P5U8_ALLMI|nr:hypothetical protein Y1Q_0016747 [Alligator mississippiensis]